MNRYSYWKPLWVAVVLAMGMLSNLVAASGASAWQENSSQKNSSANDDSLKKIIDAAAEKAVGKQTFELAYKFRAGDVWRWNVEHTTSTRIKVAGTGEESSSRSLSVKRLKIVSVDANQVATIENSVESANLWRKIGDDEPMTFDSANPPAEIPQPFQSISKSIGKVISTVTANTQGQVLSRSSEQLQNLLGLGDLFIPLPNGSVPIGKQWSQRETHPVADEDGKVQKIDLRVLYELEKVVEGKAYISFRTQVLTPLTSDTIRSKLMQKINSGYAVLDIEKGCPVYKEFEWNEKVQGYQGPDSFLQNLSKLTERYINESEVNQSLKPASVASTVNTIRSRDEKPTLRK